MSNEKTKSNRRPYTKKKSQKSLNQESSSERKGNLSRGKSSKHSSSDKKPLGSLFSSSKSSREASEFEPDERTRHAISKKQYTSDKLRGFASDHARTLIVLGAIIVSLWIMYPAVKGYYVSKRNLEVYTAVEQYISNSNAEMEAKIESLNSEEGIKAQARDRGLVEPGEIAVVIQEPSKQDAPQEDQNAPSNPFAPKENNDNTKGEQEQKQQPAKPASKGVEEKEKMKKVVESIRDNATPLQKFLDFIFGYKPPDIKVF